MTSLTIEAQLQDRLTHFPVVVLMQRQPSRVSRWSDYQWEAIGVMGYTEKATHSTVPQLVHEEGEVRQYLYSGFDVRLYIDECESYYYNLISPISRCYVIARKNEENIPVPFMVSMSFDEAHAYMETDEEVYAVDVPPELYRWTEDFVLMHYAPEKRKKRKRDDSDSEAESDKNFDPDSFHLDLEEVSLKGSESDINEDDIDWGDDNVSVE